MNKRPKNIRFVKIDIPEEEFEQFDTWFNRIEDSVVSEEDLLKTIKECKVFYGERFNKIFDEPKMNSLHENYLDISLWELKHLQ